VTVEARKDHGVWELKLSPSSLSAALVIGLSIWILWSFIQPILWGSVLAVATWPIYRRFAAQMPGRLASSATPLLFTTLIALVVLGPMVFAAGTLAVQAQNWVAQIAAANETGLAAPGWLKNLPLVGTELAERWQAQLGTAAGVSAWLQRADATAVLGWAQTLGQFLGRHLFRVSFALLVLFFLYRGGESLARECERLIPSALGDRGEQYMELAIRSVRANVASTLVVGVFDGVLAGVTYAIAGVPHAQFWGALTGLFAVVPFLGYVVVIGVALVLAAGEAAALAWAVFFIGAIILFVGDKVVRPLLVGGATQLGFVWVLMSTLGGVELMGLLGIFVGPVVLTLAAAVWRERMGVERYGGSGARESRGASPPATSA
jgi:predicted PurR-regulated permease PerM